MFKTKEELKLTENDDPTKMYRLYNKGINDAFKSFAERVEFYKKWKDDMYEFWREYHSKLTLKEKKEMAVVLEYRAFDSYNDWLFDHCFGDVIE